MKLALQKALYDTAMLAAPALVVPPFLLFKRGRDQIFERFGFWNVSLEKSIWLHGASLGEMIGLANIAKEVRARIPDLPFFATATSATGLPKAKEFAVSTKLLPLDHSIYFKNGINSISPQAFIFGETELWPNLLNHLSQRRVPSFLVNGRISDRTFKRYLTFRPLVSDCLNHITHIFAATEKAKERFLALGAESQNISVLPNTKYDSCALPLLSAEAKPDLKKSLFKQDYPIVILSSIRPGEEEILFKAIQGLEQSKQEINYIVAPRHAEKFSYFAAKMNDYRFSFENRTKLTKPCETNFLLLDTVGELTSILPAAELAFVGGTFADYGGHNPLEAAVCGVAPVVGPYHSTVKDIVELLRMNSALYEAASVADVTKIISKIMISSKETVKLSEAAQKCALSFSGSSAIIAEKVARSLNRI